MYLAAAFMAGVFLAGRYGLPLPALGLFVIATLMLGALLGSMRRSVMPALLVLALLLGMLRVEVFERDLTSTLAEYHSRQSLQVRGLVVSDPEPTGAFTRFRLSVESVKQDDEWLDVSGDALVTLRASSALARLRNSPYFRYGDRLLLEGALEAPPVLEDFDYPSYLARQGIASVMSFPDSELLDEGQGALFYRWLYGTRRRIADSLARLVPEPQASMGQALLLGIRDNLPEELVEDFRETGTSHILAISGLHVGILLGISLIASQWLLGRRRHFYLLLPLILMWLYALVSGMSPSVTRAAIMGSVYLVALLLGRPRSVLPALGLAAAVMVGVSPNVLSSVSFQLSFAAMVGITFIASSQRDRLWIIQMKPATLMTWLVGAIVVTIAATLATLPLLAFYFERVSLVGILATLLVMPALPLALAAHAVTGILSLIWIWPAQFFGWIAWAATAYITGVVGLIARFPVASVEIGWVSSAMVWVYYGLLVLFFARKTLRRAVSWVVESVRGLSSLPLAGKSVSWWILAPVISVAVMSWIAALSLPDSRLHVVFIDVGQGDAAFITTPDGHQIVVDGGPDPLELVRFLGENMPFRDRTIDLVVLTHAHGDHVNGLIEALRQYDVRRVLERDFDYDSPFYEAWRLAVENEGAEVVQAQSGQVIAFGDGVSLEVVSPPSRLLRGTPSDVDNASVVVRLVYGEISFLLTGDMFREAEAMLVVRDALIDADVLKVGHHGSRTSTSSAFLDAVSPAIAVVSAGKDNSFGHPHLETVENLQNHVSEEMLFLTMDTSTIEFVTDGKHLEVKTEQ